MSTGVLKQDFPTPRRVCVFAHYDPHNCLDPHVFYYLSRLTTVVERLLVVSACHLGDNERRQLAEIGAELYTRDNSGFDFGSYRFGLDQLADEHFEELVLCNDSVYGPLTDLKELFQGMAGSSADFWGITLSEEISMHLQSYFLVLRKPVLNSEVFARFWREFTPSGDKQQVIENGEVGLSRSLLDAGYHCDQLVSTIAQPLLKRLSASASSYGRRFRRRWREPGLYRHLWQVLTNREPLAVNPTQLEWKQLLAAGTPFVKIELLRSDPLGVAERDEILEALAQLGSYPTELISAHLNRVSPKAH